MTYQFEVNKTKFRVETERHGYRTRFYAVEIDTPENFWYRHGYIGSYMPGSHTCGFSFQDGRAFNMPAKGPKIAAQMCLVAFLNTLPVGVK